MANKKNFYIFKYFLIAILAVLIIPALLFTACKVNNNTQIPEKSIGTTGENKGLNDSANAIDLPGISKNNNYTLDDALSNRRSVRNFSKQEIEIEKISMLLWAAQGITKSDSGYRTAPSAGALYPIEIFIFKKDGIFYYLPEGHRIACLEETDLRQQLYEACLFQKPVLEAPLSIVITAVYERTTAKYGERGIRYTDMEAGHVCQNILLEATSLELGAVPIGAFEDEAIREIIGLTEDYAPLYVIPAGYPLN